MALRKPGRGSSRAVRMERWQWLLGTGATVLIALLWYAGTLDFFERQTESWRARWFWTGSPGPSDKVVVVALDDQALQTVGRWPWNREKLAVVVEEIRRANASVVALDILLDDPQNPRLALDPDAPATPAGERDQPALPQGTRNIIDDQLLADAIKAQGKVVAAANFRFQRNQDDDATGSLAAGGTEGAGGSGPSAPAKAQSDVRFNPIAAIPLDKMLDVVQARRQRLGRIERPDEEEIILREIAPQFLDAGSMTSTLGPQWESLSDRYRVATTLLAAMEGGSVPIPSGAQMWARSSDAAPPIPVIAQAAGRLANVNFSDSYDADGSVRRIPLWVQHRDRLWPGLGLAAVMEHLQIGTDNIRVEGAQTIIAIPGGATLRVPMIRSRFPLGTFDGLIYIRWPRGLTGREEMLNASVSRPGVRSAAAMRQAQQAVNGWQWQFFDLVGGRSSEVPAGLCYEPELKLETVRDNLTRLRLLTSVLNASLKAGEIEGVIVPDERSNALLAAARVVAAINRDTPDWRPAMATLQQAFDAAFADVFEWLYGEFGIAPEGNLQVTDHPPDLQYKIDNARTFIESAPLALFEVEAALNNIDQVRRELRNRLDGKIVFVGWTATGVVADFVSTAIHPRTPGVHVHAAVASAILTGHLQTQWPSTDWIMIIVLGLSGAWAGIRTGVLGAPIAVAAIVIGWFLVAGVVLFDLNHILVSVAGPATASIASCAAVLLHRLLIERKDRASTEERFKSYVSPELVAILVENPELRSMTPVKREMTVMFTDVADFTTMSERLGPVKLAKTLDIYLGAMTKILQGNRGTRDKYLGDGIMCFWNAPLDDPDHALHGCQTAILMIKELNRLNDTGAFGEAGSLAMRIGITAGELMVGDFGNPPRNSSYTVLGDTANLSARLEGANKFFGTRVLTNGRVRDLTPNLLWRPVARLVVKGKKESEVVHELIGDLAWHGDSTNEWAKLTQQMFDAYTAANFPICEQFLEVLESRFGDDRLADMYRHSMEDWAARPDFHENFDGSIALKEK